MLHYCILFFCEKGKKGAEEGGRRGGRKESLLGHSGLDAELKEREERDGERERDLPSL